MSPERQTVWHAVKGRHGNARYAHAPHLVAMIATLVFASVARTPVLLATEVDNSRATRPNIVLFLSDDMSWGQPGFNGGTEVDTPNIDRNGVLTIRGIARGVTTITVTAADRRDERVAQSFRVRVLGPALVPLFPSASDPQGREGFVRVINRSREAGEVSVEAVDDNGAVLGPVALSIAGKGDKRAVLIRIMQPFPRSKAQRRAIDNEGELLKALVTKQRDGEAAHSFIKGAMKHYG